MNKVWKCNFHPFGLRSFSHSHFLFVFFSARFVFRLFQSSLLLSAFTPTLWYMMQERSISKILGPIYTFGLRQSLASYANSCFQFFAVVLSSSFWIETHPLYGFSKIELASFQTLCRLFMIISNKCCSNRRTYHGSVTFPPGQFRKLWHDQQTMTDERTDLRTQVTLPIGGVARNLPCHDV